VSTLPLYYPTVKKAILRYAREHDLPVPGGFRVDIDSFGVPAATLLRNVEAHAHAPVNGIPGNRDWPYLRKYGLPANILKIWKAEQARDIVEVSLELRAMRWMAKAIGEKEQFGMNDGPWLRSVHKVLDKNYMHEKHQPYCADIGFDAAYSLGAKVPIARTFRGLNTNYCPSIADAIRAGLRGNDYRLMQVSFRNSLPGDVLVFRWGNSPVESHLGRARSKFDGNGWATWEANTPPSDKGDQSGLGGGDGIWPKYRPAGVVAVCGRLVPA